MGIALVCCEGIAQKAKKMVKETRNAGLDWSWLNGIIKADVKKDSAKKETTAVFLEELVAGRPVIAYPGVNGGPSGSAMGEAGSPGIAAKGFSPATMILTDNFIAIGTQLKVELQGKGCVAMPVDSIEGPFVRLRSGEALRVNDAEQRSAKDSGGGDNLSGGHTHNLRRLQEDQHHLQPTSYVEEFWEAQLEQAGDEHTGDIDFKTVYAFSINTLYQCTQVPVRVPGHHVLSCRPGDKGR